MPSKKDNLLSYLNSVNLDLGESRFLTQEEIDASTSSYLIEKDYDKYKDYLSKGNTQVVHDAPETWDEKRAKNQSGFAKFGNSLGQMVGTFGTALGSTVAALGGAVVGGVGQLNDLRTGEDNTDFMDTMINNPVMKGINEFDTYLKEDLLPTYYTKEQQESILSASTGTDLLNGIGFLASNVIPNAAITKAFGSWAKVVAMNKVGKLAPATEALVKAGTLTTQEAGIISNFAGFLNKAGPVVGAAVGRIGESAIESYDTYESIKQSLTAERDKNRRDMEIYGVADNPEMANLSDEAIEEKAKTARNNVFGGNMFLAASDMMQFSRWMRGPGIGERLAKEGIKNVAKSFTKKEAVGSLLKEAGQEAAEEGFQFLLQKGAEKQATKGGSFLDGITESTDELFTTVEGQKSMLLGAVLGGGMSGLMNFRRRGEIKQQVQQAIEQYNALGDTKERYITDENGKRVVNPELSKSASKFMYYEKIKQEAIAEGNLSKYELAEKIQFASTVAAKKSFGDYDTFIDELESMSTLTTEEAEQYFGELPTKNGRKMSPAEVVKDKVAFAERINKMLDGLNNIASINPLLPVHKNHIVSYILKQESIRDQIIENEGKINEIKSRAKLNPVTNETELFEADQLEIDKLTKIDATLKNEFKVISKEVTSLISKPEKAVKEVENQQEEEIEEIVDEAEKQQIEQQNKLADVINNQETIIVETPEGQKEVQIVGLDEETGNPIDNEGNVIDPEQVLAGKDLASQQLEPEIQDNIPEEEYNDSEEAQDGPLKTTIMATSTRGHAVEGGLRFSTPTGSPTGEMKFQLEFPQVDIITKMSDPNNTPSETKKYHVEVFIEELNNEQKLVELDKINKHRKDRNIGGPLTLAELESDEHLPLRVVMYQNGKVFSNDKTPFHDIDYFVKTAEYERIFNEHGAEAAEARKREHLATRSKIIEALRDGRKVTFPIVAKSTGMINYNPFVDKKKQVNPLIGGKGIGVFNHIKPQGKAKGIGVVTDVTEEDYTVEFSDGSKATYPLLGSWVNPKKGKTVFETVAANNTPILIDGITSRQFTPEHIASLTELFLHKLFKGNTLFKGKKNFEIVNSNRTGILNQLIYLGNNQNAPEKSIYFTKSGNLRVGRTEFTPDSDPNKVAQAIEIFIGTHKPYPKVSITGLDIDIILPTSIEDNGEITSDESTQKVWEFLFKGNQPLIGSNVNSDVNFINSYFVYDNPVIEQSQPQSYAEELSKEQTPTQSTDIKADIERRKEEIEDFRIEAKEDIDSSVLGNKGQKWGTVIRVHRKENTNISKQYKLTDFESKELLEKEIDKIYDAALAALKNVPLTNEGNNTENVQNEEDKVTEKANIERRTIQMQPDNVAKIINGIKTTTTRSESQAKQINIPIGKTAVVNIGGKDFLVTNRGLLNIEEAGGREAMEKSENFENNTPKYQQTKNWLNGKGKLYVYDIVKEQTPPTTQSDAKIEKPEVDITPIIEHKTEDCNGTGNNKNPINPAKGGKKLNLDDIDI